jgi:hypothetical protein
VPESPHPYDGIADDLFSWMEEEVGYYVEAIRGGYRNPFTAEVSEKEKRDYYTRMMFKTKPDGTVEYDQPNPEGRDTILKKQGTQAYAEILSMVTPKQGLRAPVDPIQETLDANLPRMPEDEDEEAPEEMMTPMPQSPR